MKKKADESPKAAKIQQHPLQPLHCLPRARLYCTCYLNLLAEEMARRCECPAQLAFGGHVAHRVLEVAPGQQLENTDVVPHCSTLEFTL